MDLANSPFFTLLRARLDQLSERQRLISENIANASTPGYRPRDLDTAAFERALAAASSGGGDSGAGGAGGGSLAMTRTNPGHIATGGGGAMAGARLPEARIVTRDDSETTIDGNAVVLEDEMARAAENRMAFETGIALYQKGLELYRLAARAPGR